MISDEGKYVSADARRIYEDRPRSQLERTEKGRYVAIEPKSGDHFLGDNLDEAVTAALERYPDRLTHVIRIGYRAALDLGFAGVRVLMSHV